jgi:hypothetical protein
VHEIFAVKKVYPKTWLDIAYHSHFGQLAIAPLRTYTFISDMFAGLLGCWAAGLLGCWAAGLLGCWAAGPLGRWAAKPR